MCGRFAITLPPEAVRAWFGYPDQPNFPPRFNIAPTQPVPVVRLDGGERRFALMRWGLIPGWVKEVKGFPLLFNVRAETASDKAASRGAFRYRRCVLPADGFYEWRRDPGPKKVPGQAFLIRRPDRTVFALAGLWETWMGADGTEIDTVAILTTAAQGHLARIHERCPVVLAREILGAWLDPAARVEDAEALLRTPFQDGLDATPVGPAVNRVAADGPEVQEPIGEVAPAPVVGEAAQGSLF